MLEVRRSNVSAQRLYETTGFATTGIRKGYYSDNGEDALAMTLELSAKT
jgi:ribosomal-protein-alanine N-acetyltransferase